MRDTKDRNEVRRYPFLLDVRLAKDGKQEQGSFMYCKPVNSACGNGGGDGLMIKESDYVHQSEV